MKIIVVCGSGLGTNLVIEVSIKGILKDLSVSAGADYADLGSAKGTPDDIYVGTKDIVEQLVTQSVTGEIVVLENVIDKRAMRERLSVVLNELDAL